MKCQAMKMSSVMVMLYYALFRLLKCEIVKFCHDINDNRANGIHLLSWWSGAMCWGFFGKLEAVSVFLLFYKQSFRCHNMYEIVYSSSILLYTFCHGREPQIISISQFVFVRYSKLEFPTI